MAVVSEPYYIRNREFVRTYSDSNRYVVGGMPEAEYEEANDPAEFNRVYTEGEPINGGDE